MAIAKTARIVSTEPTAAGTCVLELEADSPLGFIGGQYLIIDSGLVLPTGKAAKRAYSIFTSDADQRRFRLAVKRIPDGMVSAFMHGLTPGATLTFSGPWGKIGPTGPADVAAAEGTTVILATDTGISAALGLVQAARMRALLPTTVLLWLQPSGEEFLPEALVRAHIPEGTGQVRFAALPPIGHPERIPHARGVIADELARGSVARAYISGDGAVNYAVLDDLVAAGIPATRDSVESFFNMPKKSA